MSVPGGIFANGAVTGAFAYAFGSLAQRARDEQRPLTFGSREELQAALADGKVTIGGRPMYGVKMEGSSGGALDVNNVEFLHEQVFYVDENGALQNRGFFSDGVRADTQFPGNIKSYRFETPFTPNQSVGSFIQRLAPAYPASSYHLLFCNCQDFAGDVRRGLQ